VIYDSFVSHEFSDEDMLHQTVHCCFRSAIMVPVVDELQPPSVRGLTVIMDNLLHSFLPPVALIVPSIDNPVSLTLTHTAL